MRRPAVILVAGLFVVLGLQWWLSGRDLAVGQTWKISAAPFVIDDGRMRATIGAISREGWTEVVHVSVIGVPGPTDGEIPYIAFSRSAFEDAVLEQVGSNGRPHPDFHAALARFEQNRNFYFEEVAVGIYGVANGTVLMMPLRPEKR